MNSIRQTLSDIYKKLWENEEAKSEQRRTSLKRSLKILMSKREPTTTEEVEVSFHSLYPTNPENVDIYFQQSYPSATFRRQTVRKPPPNFAASRLLNDSDKTDANQAVGQETPILKVPTTTFNDNQYTTFSSKERGFSRAQSVVWTTRQHAKSALLNDAFDRSPSPVPRHVRRYSQPVLHEQHVREVIRKPLRQQLTDNVHNLSQDPRGKLHFSVKFDSEAEILTVRIIEAELKPFSSVSDLNPYCKITLLPFHENNLISKRFEKTNEPKFEQDFYFEIVEQKLHMCSLEILVYSYDQESRDQCLGKSRLSLMNLNIHDDVMSIWKTLEPLRPEEDKDFGEIKLSLNYLQGAERLSVNILEARNIRTDTNDRVRVKVSVKTKNDQKDGQKKQTSFSRAGSGGWQESLVFDCGSGDLRETFVEVTVVARHGLAGLAGTDILGKVSIGGAVSQRQDLKHWHDLLLQHSTKPRWHKLVL